MYLRQGVIAALVVSTCSASESGIEEEASLQSSTLSGGDYFGGAVAVAAGTVLVSSFLDVTTGSVSTFEKNSFDAWAETNHWTDPDGSLNEGFGSSVSISKSLSTGDDFAAVGASGGDLDFGAVFMYRRTAKGSEEYTYYQWEYLQRLVVDELQTGDKFGASVALDGETLLVGCPFGDGQDATDSGRAFIFTFNEETELFEYHQELPKPTLSFVEHENDYFGSSVALSGNTAVVGAYNSDFIGVNAGAAFVYTAASKGTWTFHAELVSGDTVDYDFFGFSVAVSGDYALVGAFGVDVTDPNDVDSTSGADQTGAAYLFKRSGSTWSQKQKLTAPTVKASDQFGASVSLGSNGATALVSARNDNGVGACYLFTGQGSELVLDSKFYPSDGKSGDFFGFSTALDDATGIAVVGAPLKGEGEDAANSGGAYVYRVPLGVYKASAAGISGGAVFAIVFCVLLLACFVGGTYFYHAKKQRGEDPMAQCKDLFSKITQAQSEGSDGSKYHNMGPEANKTQELL